MSKAHFLHFRARFLPLLESAKADCLKVVVGTKRDLLDEENREISVDEAVAFAKEINNGIDISHLNGAPYFETSAKNGYNVQQVFEYMFKYVLPEANSDKMNVEKSTVDLNSDSNTQGGKCNC